MFIIFELNSNQREDLILKSSYNIQLNYDIVIFLTKVDDSNIIIFLFMIFMH
jgi:hypothetical protein